MKADPLMGKTFTITLPKNWTGEQLRVIDSDHRYRGQLWQLVDGMNEDMIMIGPPYIIEKKKIDEILQILKLTLAKVEKEVS